MTAAQPTILCSDEEALLAECKRAEGPALNPLNKGRANCATTYRTDFCELVADLLLLYQQKQIADPIGRVGQQFRSRGIKSCRGAEMTTALVQYLVDHHVKRLEKKSGFRVLDRLVGAQCQYCGAWKRGLATHIKALHSKQAKTPTA